MTYLTKSIREDIYSEVRVGAALLTPPPPRHHLPRKPHNEVNEVNEVRRSLDRSHRYRLPQSKRIGRLL